MGKPPGAGGKAASQNPGGGRELTAVLPGLAFFGSSHSETLCFAAVVFVRMHRGVSGQQSGIEQSRKAAIAHCANLALKQIFLSQGCAGDTQLPDVVMPRCWGAIASVAAHCN